MKKIILSLVMLNSVAFASTTDDLLNKIKNIQSMSANFEQKMIDGQSNNNINSKGTMSLKKPQFFKWITTSPNNQKIVSNGKKLWIYDGDLEQLIIKQVSNNISQFPYLILLSKNSDNLNKLFTIKEKDSNFYILKPKNDEMINNIAIKFRANGDLDYLDISTSLNQYTQIKFSDVKDNSSTIKASDFDFKAPQDTDVIDETIGKPKK